MFSRIEDKIFLQKINLANTNITSISNSLFAIRQQGVPFNTSGASYNISSQFVGKVPNGSDTQAGVVTTLPYNYVELWNPLDKLPIFTPTDSVVFGRLTYATSVWTLSFFYLNLSGNEVSYNIPTPIDIALAYIEVYTLETKPVFETEVEVVPFPSNIIASKVPITPFERVPDLNVQDALETIDDNIKLRNIGLVTNPTITYPEDGTGIITISSCIARSYKTVDWTGNIVEYTVPEQQINLTTAGPFGSSLKNQVVFITIDYNSGSPIYRVYITPAYLNRSSQFLIGRGSWEYQLGVDDDFHYFLDDRAAINTASRLAENQIAVNWLERGYGLDIIDNGSGIFTVDSGIIYSGVSQYIWNAKASNDDHYYSYFKSSGGWVFSLETEFNTLYYNDGVDRQELDVDKYAVTYLWVTPANNGSIYAVLGEGNYTRLEAIEAPVPTIIPNIINYLNIYIGRIITKKLSYTPELIENAFDDSTSSLVATNTRYLTNLMSTGIINGGLLSINSSTTFDMTSVTGVIVNNYSNPDSPTRELIVKDALVNEPVPYISIPGTTYINIDVNGNFVYSLDPPTNEDRRDLICIGWLDHPDGATLSYVFTEPYLTIDVQAQLNDFFEAMGPFNIYGNDYYANGANLKINRDAGSVFDANANYINSLKNPHVVASELLEEVDFYYYYRKNQITNPGEWVNDNPSTNLIDPDFYDDGSGTLQAVTVGSWTIQVIMYYPLGNVTDIQYGQVEYLTYAEALVAVHEQIQMNPYLSWDIIRSFLIVKQGTVALNDPLTAVFHIADRFGNASGASSGGGGEVNTASNQGLDGVGLYDIKVAEDLQFRNIAPGSNKVTVIHNNARRTVEIDIDPTKHTHIASQITDFDTEVSNNIDVASCTSLKHSSATVVTTNGLSIIGQQISIGLASISTNGALSSTDWNIFNNKENAIGSKNTAFNKNYGATATDVKINGSQSVGAIDEIARIDHVHPTDTSRQTQDADLDAIAALTASGFATKINNSPVAWAIRTLVESASRLLINNSDGVSGNPTFTIPTTLLPSTGTTRQVMVSNGDNANVYATTKIYEPSATDPVSPVPADGDIRYDTTLKMWMFYDSSRSKWLSFEIATFSFMSNGTNAASGVYLRFASTTIMSATVGFVMPRNGTVIGISYYRSDNDALTFDIRSDGSSIATLASSANTGSTVASNGDFTAGQSISGYNAGANTLNAPYCVNVFIRWRV